MNRHSFFASNEQRNYRCDSVINKAQNLFNYGESSRIESDCPDRDLRSCALKSAQEGDYTEAIALLSHLIHRHPENALDYNNRGLIYFQSGERKKALDDYNMALQLDPKLASAYNNRGNCYAASGELMAAIADYDRALDINPGYVRAWINRGITLRDLEQYDQAIEDFEIALLFGQLEGHILSERGRTHHLSGDWNCAIADYNRALAILPSPTTVRDYSEWRLRTQVENWLNELLCYR